MANSQQLEESGTHDGVVARKGQWAARPGEAIPFVRPTKKSAWHSEAEARRKCGVAAGLLAAIADPDVLGLMRVLARGSLGAHDADAVAVGKLVANGLAHTSCEGAVLTFTPPGRAVWMGVRSLVE